MMVRGWTWITPEALTAYWLKDEPEPRQDYKEYVLLDAARYDALIDAAEHLMLSGSAAAVRNMEEALQTLRAQEGEGNGD